jgi:transglutaminase-like putative cysteine protease
MKLILGGRWPGWGHLPREVRDTLFLLSVIAWTIAPHLFHLPWWTGALAGVVLLWRARLALAGAGLPGRWTLLGVLAVSVTLTLITERTLLGREAGVMMLVLLMVLKTLELRAQRDALVVFFLGFFLVLTNFLYSQSIGVALAMVIAVWGLLTALVLAHMPVGQPSLKQAATLSARAAALGAPVMVVLFLLFPRIGPLWGLPQDAGGKTGLSGSMRMGAVAEIANDDSIAMRVRFFGPPPPPSALYFRGPVLTRFDGVEWQREPANSAWQLPAELQVEGPPLRYEVTLEPSRLPLVALLEATPDTPGSAPLLPGYTLRRRSDLQWAIDRPVAERLRFEATAWLRFRHGPQHPLWGLREHIQLPPGYNPRTLQWAAEQRRNPRWARANAQQLAQMLMDHIRSGGYSYTLAPGDYGRDAVDEFWLDRKTGFCEHFASAFVVIMRAFDVPARIVTGYQGTDLQPVDGYWAVRQSHAHAWAEYWVPGRGWLRADPTAAVAPERVQRSAQLAPRRGVVESAIVNVSPALMQSLRAGWEALNNRWNQWVLGYSRQQQFDLLQRLGLQSADWTGLVLALAWIASAAAVAGAAWAWWDRRRQDPWQRLHGRVRRRLQRLGVDSLPHHPPRTLAAAVRSTLGDGGEALARQLDALDRLRYAGGGTRHPPRRWWRGFSAEAVRTAVAIMRR